MSDQTLNGGDVSVESDDALRVVYGESAAISRIGKFTLIHLDSPSEALVKKRGEEFDPDEFFFDSCPLCQIARESGGHIIFNRDEALSDDSTAREERER